MKRINWFQALALVAVAAGVSQQTLSAGVVTLDAATRGWLTNDPGFPNGNTPFIADNNYLAGICGANDCLGFEDRNFFTFNVPALSGAVVSARLLLETVKIITPDASETYQVTSISASPTFASIGNGTVYGSIVYTPANSNTVSSIPLNAAALAAIVANTTFRAGGRITTLSGQTAVDELAFASSGSNGHTTRLEITTADGGSPVPEPASAVMLLLGLTGLALARRRAQ